MTLRIACVASLFFVRGWWILLVGLAAVILPYFAVIFANERATAPGSHPDQPTPREVTTGDSLNQGTPDEKLVASETLVVVDAPAERRGTPTSQNDTTAEATPQNEATAE